MSKSKKIIATSLVIIFLFGLVIRLYRLNLNTPSLYADEVGQYFIFEALKLHTVNLLRQIVYLSFSFTWLVGLTPLGVRLPSAIFGSAIGLAMFFLSRSISPKNRTLALVACVLGTFVPWSFMISRIGHTHITIIVLLTILHLILYFKAKTIQQTLFSILPVILSAYYYPSVLVLSIFVLFLPVMEVYLKLGLRQKKIFWLFLGLLLLFLAAIAVFRLKVLDIKSRGQDLAIWRDVNVTADANNYRGLARLSEPTILSFNKDTENLANKLVYNYPTSVINTFFRNYFSFFSPDFLFFKGDSVLRHSTGMVGEFFPFLLPFMIYGAFVFFQKEKGRMKLTFLIWILVSPIPAAITKDGATYLLRVITLMPFLTYFCTLGIVESFGLFKKKLPKYLLGTSLVFIGLYSTYYFYYGYFHVYPALAASSYEFGFKELADFQRGQKGALLVIWDDKYPSSYFCFWQSLPFSVCDRKKMTKQENINSSTVFSPLPDLFFSLPVSEADLLLILSKYQPLYLAVPSKYTVLFQNIEKKHPIVQTINNPDQTIAFVIYSIN